MKHFRILLPLLILALLLSACGSTSQEPYEYTFSRNGQIKTLHINPEAQTILDGTTVYRYTVEEGSNQTYYEIVYPNGGRYYWTATKHGGQGGWSDGYNDRLYLSGDILVDALQVNRPREKVGNFGLGLLLMGLGAVNFFLPELPFYLKYGWAVENAEPSDAYITWTKVGGVIAAVLGLVACII